MKRISRFSEPCAAQLLPGGSFDQHGHEITDGFVGELSHEAFTICRTESAGTSGNRAIRRRMRSSTARTSLSEGACQLVIMSPIGCCCAISDGPSRRRRRAPSVVVHG